jgi:hypothetical protein
MEDRGQSESAPGPGRPPQVGEGAIRFSHSGYRYLLGFGRDFFGIWDRQTPGGPVYSFPRTDEGWVAAWQRFAALEPHAYEVAARPVPAPSGALAGPSYRSTAGRAAWVVVLLAVAAVVAVAGVWVSGYRLVMALRARSGGFVAPSRVRAVDGALDTVASLWSLASLAAGLAWLFWQHRAQANLRALGVAELRFSPGWAVGWWFVPFANVVMPFLTVRELWRASHPEAGASDWQLRGSGPLLPLWWACYLAQNALLYAGLQLEGPDQVLRSGLLVAGFAASLAAAALAAAVVRGVEARQRARSRVLRAWAGAVGG